MHTHVYSDQPLTHHVTSKFVPAIIFARRTFFGNKNFGTHYMLDINMSPDNIGEQGVYFFFKGQKTDFNPILAKIH